MKKTTCLLLGVVALSLSACKENPPDLKTVDYWMENKERRNDYWMGTCKNETSVNDNCAVIGSLIMAGEKSGRDMYERMLRHRQSN